MTKAPAKGVGHLGLATCIQAIYHNGRWKQDNGAEDSIQDILIPSKRDE